jgi:hypothetical protein
MTEIGFKLPRSELKRLGWQWVGGLAIGMALFYVVDSEKVIHDLPWLLGITAVFLFAGGWWTGSYKWVYLSADGIRGLPTAGLRWRRISWQEPLTSKTVSSNGVKGRLFKSQKSGDAVFIPLAILALPDFKASVEQHGGCSHALLREVS